MKCSYSSGGKTCGAYALNDSQFCFAHDPTQRDKITEARSKGGINSTRRRYRGLAHVQPPKTKQDVLDILGEAIAGGMRKDVDSKALEAVQRLCELWLKTKELDAVQECENDELRQWEEQLIREAYEAEAHQVNSARATVDTASNQSLDSGTQSEASLAPETAEVDPKDEQPSPSVPVETVPGPPISPPYLPPSKWNPIQNSQDGAYFIRGGTIGGIAED